jgi:hypothetical protein
MRNRIPGLSETLMPRRDNFGEPVTVPQGLPWSAVNPFVFSSKPNDPVRSELARLATSSMDAKFTLPAQKRGPFDLTQITNAKGQTAYDRWLELLSTPGPGGLTLHDRLAKVMASDAYKNAAQGNEDFRENRQVRMIKSWMQTYHDWAFKKMLDEFPDLRNAIHEYERQRRRMAAGGAVTVDPTQLLNPK